MRRSNTEMDKKSLLEHIENLKIWGAPQMTKSYTTRNTTLPGVCNAAVTLNCDQAVVALG